MAAFQLSISIDKQLENIARTQVKLGVNVCREGGCLDCIIPVVCNTSIHEQFS